MAVTTPRAATPLSVRPYQGGDEAAVLDLVGADRLPTARGMREREEPGQGSGTICVAVPRTRQIRLKEVRVERAVVLEPRRQGEGQAVWRSFLIQPCHQITGHRVQEGRRRRKHG
ncbi:hypothetical protein ACWCV9_36145 [Streptomyces sp. NPDC001606]